MRISQTEYHDQFVLKDAHLFTIWMPTPHRITRDLDLLHFGTTTVSRVETLFRDICTRSTQPPDGLVFLPDTVTGQVIRDESRYIGVRIEFIYCLDTMRDRMQVDIGFGDAVSPAPTHAIFPPLLNLAGPSLLAYARETVIAEKFEAMVSPGMRNSRMKDFYDLWVLVFRQFNIA